MLLRWGLPLSSGGSGGIIPPVGLGKAQIGNTRGRVSGTAAGSAMLHRVPCRRGGPATPC